MDGIHAPQVILHCLCNSGYIWRVLNHRLPAHHHLYVCYVQWWTVPTAVVVEEENVCQCGCNVVVSGCVLSIYIDLGV